ncbi:MAG: YbaK/EbsC family protein [Clostridia bacterium]
MNEIEKVEKFLIDNGIKYQLLRHEAVFTCEQSRRTINVEGCAACKNLFVKDKNSNRYYLIVLESTKTANMRELAGYVGARKFEFGSDDKLKETLGLYSGAVSPFGLLNDKYMIVNKVLLDEDIFSYKQVKFHPNDNTGTVIIYIDDLAKILKILCRTLIIVKSGNSLE